MICTLDGRLLAITDLLPGARHGAHAFRAHKLDEFLDSLTLADKGYVGLGLATPTKHRPGQRLNRELKTNNRVLNGLRSVVEPVSDCSRQDLADSSYWIQAAVGGVGAGVLVVCGFVLLAAGGNFEQASKYSARLRVF